MINLLLLKSKSIPNFLQPKAYFKCGNFKKSENLLKNLYNKIRKMSEKKNIIWHEMQSNSKNRKYNNKIILNFSFVQLKTKSNKGSFVLIYNNNDNSDKYYYYSGFTTANYSG